MTRTRNKTRPLNLVPAPQLINLDIACGQRKQPGYTGIDRAACEGVDIVHDLWIYPWPVADASVQTAYCSHYIEHIPMVEYNGKDALFMFFDELYRILVPGGQITIIAPYYASMRCWQDPTHRRAISEATFLYANKGWRDLNGLSHYDVRADFDFGYSYVLDQAVAARNDEARAFWMRHYQNVINDIQVTLTKR